MKKLTPKMVELLRAMQHGFTLHYSPYMGRFNPVAHYWCWTNGGDLPSPGRCTKAAEGLMQRGLVERHREGFRDPTFSLTEAGKAYNCSSAAKEPSE